MHIFSIIILTSLSVMLLLGKRPLKLAILIISVFLLKPISLGGSPFLASSNLLAIVFFISELKYFSKNVITIKQSHLLFFFIILIIPVFILWLHSPHYSGLSGLTKIVLYEIITKYFALAYGIILLKERCDFRILINAIYWCIIILTVFGVVNLVFRQAFWLDWFIQGDWGEYYTQSDRFRVQSLFNNPFNYGFVCLLAFFMGLYAKLEKLISNNRWIVILFGSLFGIFMCGCRTIIICFIIMSLTYVSFHFNNKRVLGLSLSVVLLFLISYNTIELVHNSIDAALSVFDDSQNVSGSSIEMRQEQFSSVLYHIRNDFYYGKGYRYFYFDMGWSEMREGGVVDWSLHGLEGVYLNYLLERGIIGYLFYLLIWLLLIIYSLHSLILNKTAAVTALTIIIGYVTFAHMTGELGTAYATLLFVGIFLSLCKKKTTHIKTQILNNAISLASRAAKS